MKNNKEQTSKNIVGNGFSPSNSSVARQLKAVPTFHQDPRGGFPVLDQNNKLIRRYSIDDNGGGYMGL